MESYKAVLMFLGSVVVAALGSFIFVSSIKVWLVDDEVKKLKREVYKHI